MKPAPKQLIALAKLPALLVSSLANVRYLSGFSDEGALLLVTKKGYTLLVSPLEIGMATAAVYEGVKVKNIKDIEKYILPIKKCGFEEHHVTVARLKRWKKLFKKTEFVTFENVIEECRRSKSTDEIKHLKKALRITDEVLAKVPSLLIAGVSEKNVAWKIEQLMRERGAEGISFDVIVGFGSHTARPHHAPTDRKLKKRDIVQIDCGAKVNGYHGDRSEVFFIGEPTMEQQRVYSVVLQAKNSAKEKMRAGIKASAADGAARKIFAEHKMEKYFDHTLGHGVGLQIHERPMVSVKSVEVLLKNEVITVEPGIYIPGKFGIRLEDMVFVR